MPQISLHDGVLLTSLLLYRIAGKRKLRNIFILYILYTLFTKYREIVRTCDINIGWFVLLSVISCVYYNCYATVMRVVKYGAGRIF